MNLLYELLSKYASIIYFNSLVTKEKLSKTELTLKETKHIIGS